MWFHVGIYLGLYQIVLVSRIVVMSQITTIERFDIVELAIETQTQLLRPNQNFVMSDETQFDVNGDVNKPNYRFWGNANLQGYREKPLHDWFELGYVRIASLGLNFMKMMTPRRFPLMVTVIGQNDTFFPPKSKNIVLGGYAPYNSFNHDFLCEMFPGRLVPKNTYSPEEEYSTRNCTQNIEKFSSSTLHHRKWQTFTYEIIHYTYCNQMSQSSTESFLNGLL